MKQIVRIVFVKAHLFLRLCIRLSQFRHVSFAIHTYPLVDVQYTKLCGSITQDFSFYLDKKKGRKITVEFSERKHSTPYQEHL